MKKLLIVFLALILILGGLFLWRGGHHAVFLAAAMEDWLDDDASSLAFQAEVNGLALSGGAFWTEWADRTVYGLESEGYGLYIHDGVLYLDTGTAYTLPRIRPDWTLVRKLLTGAIVHGRITKDNGVYHLSMATEELTLEADITAREEVEALIFDAVFPVEGEAIAVRCSLIQKPEEAHPLPRTVLDAMVRSKMEPPMSITEPLEVLLPAMNDLLPLEGAVTLGVECGILSVSETVGLAIRGDGAALTRDGETVPLSFPDGLSRIDPLTAGLALLGHGTFTQTADAAEFRLTLSPEMTAQLAAELVPQLQSLGITFSASEATVTIRDGTLTSAAITATGTIPFLLTTIPLSFSAQFDIS